MDLATYEPTVAELAGLFRKSSRWLLELRSRGVMPADGATLGENVEAWLAYNSADDETALDLTKERARLTKEQADAAEMKNAQLRGELLPLGLYQSAMQSVFVAFRAALLNLPNELAPQIVTVRERREAAEMLTDAVHRALETLSETNFDQLLQGAGLGDGDSGEDSEAAAEADVESVG